MSRCVFIESDLRYFPMLAVNLRRITKNLRGGNFAFNKFEGNAENDILRQTCEKPSFVGEQIMVDHDEAQPKLLSPV